jgi:hypothetical protein
MSSQMAAGFPQSQRHQCLVYEGAPSRHLDSLAQTLIERIGANRRCLYLNSPAMVAGMRSRLSAMGFDLNAHTLTAQALNTQALNTQAKKGALVLSSDNTHLVGGKFDVARMLSLLADSLRQALDDGYDGLWATGDMTWELGGERNFDKLVAYERGLEEFMKNNPALSGVCQYHRDTLPLHAVKTAMETHPASYVNATLSQFNPAYRSA